MNSQIKSLYDWYRNTLRNPKYRWYVILGTLVYLISPIDLLPDIFPIVGQVDDLMLLTLLLSELSQIVYGYFQERQAKAKVASQSKDTSKTVEAEVTQVN